MRGGGGGLGAGGIDWCINIPSNCSDTAIRVAKAMIGAKVMILRFAVFARLSQGYSAFSHIGNWAEIFHMNPRRNWPGNRAIPVSWAHVRRPSFSLGCVRLLGFGSGSVI